MRNKTKVIQISGFRGLLMAIFVVTCLAAGFVAFPSLIAMKIWNYAAKYYISIPTINMWQGLILWAIIAISGYMVNEKNKFLTAFSSNNQLSEDELKKILERTKLHAKARKALDNFYLHELKPIEKENNTTEEKKKENV